jgi:2-polyprenyl-3-methyl-5-hydroxy-6-metoxy-1,4-benzoquinol methylase
MSTRTEWIVCNACGADAFQELANAGEWHIGRCGKCALIYVNPMPSFAPSDQFSQISLDFEYTRFQSIITSESLAHDRQQIRQQLGTVAQLADPIVQPARFLDIGCGSGSSVRAAAEMGWDAVGVDIDPRLVELGRKQLNVNLRCSTVVGSGLEGNQFHFIRLRDVIEHLPNPYEVLCEIKRLLVPGGVALIATPNEGALPTQVRLRLGFKRNKIATVAPPHHVHGFTPETLARILLRAQLKVREIATATPVDAQYVTARNMKSANKKMRVFAWRLANAVGRGSMLVAWVRNQ